MGLALPMKSVNGSQYCVYAHRSQGEIFYIGQGLLGRPFDAKSRSARWRQFVKDVGAYDVEILGYFSTRSAALQEETRLIREWMPRCNVDERKAIRLLSDSKKAPFPGYVLRTVREEQGLSQDALSALAHVRQCLISELESGKKKDTLGQNWVRLADALGVPVETFLRPECQDI